MLIRSGGNAKSYLGIVLSVIEMNGTSKEYKEEYEVDNDIALSTLYRTLSFYQEIVM